MTHPLFALDEEFARQVFAYCRDRLSLDPVPLDYGGLLPIPDGVLDNLFSETGRSAEEVLALYRDHLAPSIISVDSTACLAFIPNAPSKMSSLFDMVIAASGLAGTNWVEAAGAVAAENQALEFLARRAGLPAGAGGTFVPGGTAGNLSALTVARDVGRARHPDIAPHEVRIALSEEAHSSIGTALHVIGVTPLYVPTDDHRLTRRALEAALARDPHPETVVGVVATAGTTNAGIIDDLEGLGSFAREHDLWFHVDGAYGGAAMFSSSHREQLSGLRHANSFIVDPHKWLFAPFDCCALIYREPTLARHYLAQRAGYLDITHEETHGVEDWNPSDFALHLSRRARGLPFWFSLAVHGVTAYESAVEAAIELARRTAELVEASDHLKLVRPPGLSVVLFRRPGWNRDDYFAWSHRLLREQIAFVVPTTWEGETIGRVVFLHPDTPLETVERIIESARD